MDPDKSCNWKRVVTRCVCYSKRAFTIEGPVTCAGTRGCSNAHDRHRLPLIRRLVVTVGTAVDSRATPVDSRTTPSTPVTPAWRHPLKALDPGTRPKTTRKMNFPATSTPTIGHTDVPTFRTTATTVAGRALRDGIPRRIHAGHLDAAPQRPTNSLHHPAGAILMGIGMLGHR